MSNIPTNKDKLNDVDLSALFAADKTEPSADLDKLILENARQAQHNSIPKNNETFIDRYAPLFGTAAVLMIAFALTPLTMQSPDSSLAQDAAPAASSVALENNSGTTAVENQAKRSDAASTQADAGAMTEQTAAITTDFASQRKQADVDREELEAKPEAVAETANGIVASVNPEDSKSNVSKAVKETIIQAETVIQSNELPIDGLGEVALSDSDDAVQTSDAATRAKIEIVELQSAPVTPEAFASDTTATRAAAPSIATANDANDAIVATPATAQEPDAELEAAPEEPVAISSGVLAAAPIAQLKQRPQNVKYKSSALLWVIEIKHLFKENKVEMARKELLEFRLRYPENSNERLLPKELLDSMGE